MKRPYQIEHLPIQLKELSIKDQGARILYRNKENKEYGIYSHSDQNGAHIFFAGNLMPMCIGFETKNEFFKAEVI